MKIGILISNEIEGKFGLKIKDSLIKRRIPFFFIKKLPHYLTDEDLEDVDADVLVAVCVHSMADKPKQFCVHPCGNWGKKWPHPVLDNLGGEENKLALASGNLLKQVLLPFRMKWIQRLTVLQIWQVICQIP